MFSILGIIFFNCTEMAIFDTTTFYRIFIVKILKILNVIILR